MRTYAEALKEAGRAYLEELLNHAEYCVPAAADIAGLHKSHLYHLMKEFGIPCRRQNRGNQAWRALECSPSS